MSDLPSRDAIVTVRSLPLPSQIESTTASDTQAEVDPLERAMLMNRYRALRRQLEAEAAAAGDNVLITVQSAEVSRLQSRIAEMAVEGQPLGPGGQEVKFGAGFGGRDWFGWLKSTLDWVDRTGAHPFVWSTAPVEAVPDTFSMAIVGDWGTALYGAPKIAGNIKSTGRFDVLMHLGDIYYSGTADEIKTRFIAPWPFDAGKVSRTLNANHEMYSGGFGYFDIALPRFDQKASYFAMQNAHWLIVGLDTAYIDHDMDPRQVDWLTSTIAAAGSRKVVLFSHQQLFSRLDNQGDKLEAKLRGLLERKRITAWYWGHEHQCVLYDRHPTWNLVARCLGNGGIPEPRKKEVLQAATEITKGPVTWKRIGASADKPWAPSCLALDGPNPDVKGRENDFVPHSYMTLHFEGAVLKERVQLPDGTLIFENEIQ